MAGLKKLLGSDRSFLHASSPGRTENDQNALSSVEGQPLEGRKPRLPHVDSQMFLGIEKQFEELHDQFQSPSPRPLTPKRYKYIDPKPCPLRTKHHVDLLDAIFSTHRYRVSAPVSPASLYNEDIAERNLYASPPIRLETRYPAAVSTTYQEEVADRNIVVNGATVVSAHSANRPISQQSLRGRKRNGLKSRQDPAISRSKSCVMDRSHSGESDESLLRASSSAHNLRPSSRSKGMTSSADKLPTANNTVRSINAAPTLAVPSEGCAPSSTQTGAKSLAERRAERRAARSKLIEGPGRQGAESGSQPAAPDRVVRPNPRTSSRKNIHDLSINTHLSAPRKRFVRIGDKPAQLPVPTPKKNPDSNPSIAEIVNSPVSLVTTAATLPQTPTYNVDEIMDLFKQAYSSSQTTSPHPTFESLQDAIIREINSHDAFRQICPDSLESGPPELSPDQATGDYGDYIPEHTVSRSSSRSFSAKERHRISATRKPSSRRLDPEPHSAGRELSFPALKGLESDEHDSPERTSRQRRHTYAQPPSLELLEGYEDQKAVQRRSRSIPRQRHSATPIVKGPHDPMSSPRPQSSHSRLSRAVSAILETSDPSKWSQSRQPPRSAANAKIGLKHKISGSKKVDLNQTPVPEIHLDHVSEEQLSGQERPNSTGSANLPNPPSQPAGTGSSNLEQTVPPRSKKRIPLRRSSLHRDLYDSSRFAP